MLGVERVAGCAQRLTKFGSGVNDGLRGGVKEGPKLVFFADDRVGSQVVDHAGPSDGRTKQAVHEHHRNSAWSVGF